MSNELITFLANIALTLSVIVAIIFGIAQVRSAQKDRKERLTLETMRSFQTREFAEMLHYISRVKVPDSVDGWRAWPHEDQIRFIQMSQQMESLGLLLAENLINIDLIDKTLGSFVSTTWEKAKPLVLDMRQRYDDPYLNEYFQWMAEQMKKRMNQSPRQPFFMSSVTAN